MEPLPCVASSVTMGNRSHLSVPLFRDSEKPEMSAENSDFTSSFPGLDREPHTYGENSNSTFGPCTCVPSPGWARIHEPNWSLGVQPEGSDTVNYTRLVSGWPGHGYAPVTGQLELHSHTDSSTTFSFSG